MTLKGTVTIKKYELKARNTQVLLSLVLGPLQTIKADYLRQCLKTAQV